jgi:ABC-type antimicrobial peptide transport system permease subunit
VLVAALAIGVPLIEPSVNLVVSPSAVARAAGVAALIGMIAALVPARSVARVDPASVSMRR